MEATGERVGLGEDEAGHQLITAERSGACAGPLNNSSTLIDI